MRMFSGLISRWVIFFSSCRYARVYSAWRRIVLTSSDEILCSSVKLLKSIYSIIRIDPPPSSIEFTKLTIYFCECISESLSVLISDNIYVCDILGYCDFHISFGIPSRFSSLKLFGSKQLAYTRVTGFADHFKLVCVDLII